MLADAEQRLEYDGLPEEYGENVELAEGESFTGRYRGTTLDNAWDPPREVYLLLDRDGENRYIRERAVLKREMQQAAPTPGDWIVIIRGEDGTTKDGNMFHRYAVRARLCGEPLPEQSAPSRKAEPAAPQGPLGDDDDLPF